MYFPYLRGKQFELLAIREFALKYPDNKNIVPIIEPVKLSTDGLAKAFQVMFEQNMKFAVVVNPSEGEFRRDSGDVIAELPILSGNSGKWIPAFICQDSPANIFARIQDKNLQDVMIIFRDGFEIEDDLMDFLSNPSIRYVVNGNPNSRHTTRKLQGLEQKRIIRLDDSFVNRTRNVDYSNVPEEPFTEEHYYYRKDGYYGFSDYTALPKNYSDGGMLPYAVAIHLTYKKAEEEIYVRHFVSDTNYNQSNVHLKFFEAATKARDFFSNKEKTPAVVELIQLFEDEKYPGLGAIKKLSIRNHIELMNQIL